MSRGLRIRMLSFDLPQVPHDRNLPGELLEVLLRHLLGTHQSEFSLGDLGIQHEIDEVPSADEERYDADEKLVLEKHIEDGVDEGGKDESFEDLLGPMKSEHESRADGWKKSAGNRLQSNVSYESVTVR